MTASEPDHDAAVRIEVDVDRCAGHAQCAAFAPDVYELDDYGYNQTPAAVVAPGLREQARRGALACPEQAIRIVDETPAADRSAARGQR